MEIIEPIEQPDYPGTYRQALPPDFKRAVLCWTEQKVDIARDIEDTESVILVRSPNSPPGFVVYERVAPHSQEAQRRRDDPRTDHFG